MGDEVLAMGRYPSNAGLVQAIATLGFIRETDLVLDATHGDEGVFWKEWRPARLVPLDLKATAVPRGGVQGSFTALPFPDEAFDVGVLDGPYKLNGTPDPQVDRRYGVDVLSTWRGRHDLIVAGIMEVARVSKRALLVKCQDQVSSGHVRFQRREFTEAAEKAGFHLVQEMHIEGGRPQPTGFWKCPHKDHRGLEKAVCTEGVWVERRQVHARHNFSTMLILERGPYPG